MTINMRNQIALNRRILAILEEAGEDDLSALTNSIGGQLGSYIEIEKMCCALEELINMELIHIATTRHQTTLRWIPESPEVAMALLQVAAQKFQWSAVKRIWEWPPAEARIEVLLTQEGFKHAKIVLSEDGWPT